jgi:hypothetical protein
MKKYYITIAALLTLIITFSFVYNPFIPLLTKPDSPAYKYNKIIEEQDQAKKTYKQLIDELKIKKISIETIGCLGDCPVFYAEFKNDGTAFYRGEFYTDLTGDYSAWFWEGSFIELCDYIKFAKVESLKSWYMSDCSCLSTTIIKLYYKDGSIKSIGDYGYEAPVQFKFLETHLKYRIDKMRWKKIGEK